MHEPQATISTATLAIVQNPTQDVEQDAAKPSAHRWKCGDRIAGLVVCTSYTPASLACSSRSGNAWSRAAGSSRAARSWNCDRDCNAVVGVLMPYVQYDILSLLLLLRGLGSVSHSVYSTGLVHPLADWSGVWSLVNV